MVPLFKLYSITRANSYNQCEKSGCDQAEIISEDKDERYQFLFIYNYSCCKGMKMANKFNAGPMLLQCLVWE